MKKIFIAVITLMIGGASLNAQDASVEITEIDLSQGKTSKEEQKVSLSIVNTRNSTSSIAEDFNLTASKYTNDPRAPRFLLYDKNNQVAFGIGGTVRMRAAYNFLGSSSNKEGFSPYSILFPSNPNYRANRNRLSMDPSNSTLFFKLLGHSSALELYQVYIGGDFSGDDYGFVLKDAYFSSRGFIIGHTWSSFSDMASIPPSIDFLGPNGAAKVRTSQISYAYTTPDNLTLAAALELPKTTGTYTNLITGESSQTIPDLPIYMQYTWGQKAETSHVRVAAIMRNINYRNLICNKTETATGIGVQFSSNIRITPIVEVFGQITYGSGIADYINDLAGNGLSLVKNPTKAGKMDPLEALGWFGQVRVNIADPVFVTFGYSESKVFPKSGVMTGDQYSYGEYLVGNIFYNVTNDLQLGLEYLWGRRHNLNGQDQDANCIQSALIYHF